METIITILVVAVWIAILAMMSWYLVAGWRRVMQEGGSLPFFSMLRRHGLALKGLVEASNNEQLAIAVRRCALCGDKSRCSAWLESGRQDDAPCCPNARYYNEVKNG